MDFILQLNPFIVVPVVAGIVLLCGFLWRTGRYGELRAAILLLIVAAIIFFFLSRTPLF